MAESGKRLEEQTALHLLGLLDAGEAREIECLLANGDAEALTALRGSSDLLAHLGMAAPQLEPGPEVRDRLLAEISASSSSPPVAGMDTLAVRAGEGTWQETGIPGVTAKLLYLDPKTGAATTLVRMQPGVTYPAHLHRLAEQCLVLEGDIGWENLVYHAGDFTCAAAGSSHPPVHTVSGNLLLIIGSPKDELLTKP